MLHRKKFLYLSGSLFAGAALLPGTDFFQSDKKIRKAGLQLYTLRAEMTKNPADTLLRVALAGYDQVESYEGPQGMFWGMGHSGFKRFLSNLGLKPVSSHCNIFKDFEKKTAEAAEIGMKYLVCPYVGPQNTTDAYKKLAATFNQCGTICSKAGLRFAYHNHDYSFTKKDGIFPQQLMMDETDPALVDFEMDIYWVVAAGEDPMQWFAKYPGRFRLCHIKDMSRNPGPDRSQNSVDLGTGSIDWKKVLAAANTAGMKYYIAEQEAYPNGTALEAVKTNADFLKKIRI